MAARIGTRALALEAYKRYYDNTIYDSPDIWRKIGTGGFRVCWLHIPTGVVYKIGIADWSAAHENDVEIRNARNLLRKCANNDQWVNPHVRIPLTSGFRIKDTWIVAMQFIDGKLGNKTKTSKAAREALYSLKFTDMHGMNFIVDESGTLWPIDMASPRPGHRDYTGADRRCLSSVAM